METGQWVVVVFVMLAITNLASFITGGLSGEKYVQRNAIEAGVAEWRADPKTGKRWFAFKS